jgi:hypothetical protein
MECGTTFQKEAFYIATSGHQLALISQIVTVLPGSGFANYRKYFGQR